MLSPFITAFIFLINTVFGIYILLLMLRFLLQWLRISFRADPIQRLLWRLTTPPLVLLYNFIPSWRNIDFSAILLMLVLKMIEITLVAALYGQSIGITGLFILSLAHLLSLFIYILIFAIVIQAILSWLARDSYNPLSDLLYHINEPILRPLRQRIPPIQGIDFSPIFALIALQLLDILLVGVLRQLA